MPKIRILTLLLAIIVLLTACGSIENNEKASTSNVIFETVTESERASDTETVNETDCDEDGYRKSISRSREELEEMLTLTDGDFDLAKSQLEAFSAIAVTSSDYDEVDAVYMEFEDTFYHIETQISIANVIYYIDMSNEEASAKYLESYSRFGELYNLYAEVCKEIYNKSPIRDELFADWTEAEIEQMLGYDPETQKLREENEKLLIELNSLGPDTFDDRAAEIYALMVTNNNRIAELSGFDNYYVYASEKIYKRDYGIDEIEVFDTLIQEHYIPIFDTVNNGWMSEYSSLSLANATCMYNYLFEPFDKIGTNYLKGYVESLDGSMREGLEHMFENRNVVFADSSNSHPSAFQTYLHDFEDPFCLFGNAGQNTDTLIHEMGHYYAALYNPDLESVDLAETQSQGNEMLLLAYLDGNMPDAAYNALRRYRLFTYIAESLVCVIIDEFERTVYSLDSVEGYTSEDFDAIMAEICERYGGIEFIEENVTDMGYYWRMVVTNNPVYYISYAVSMTAALSILAEAEEEMASGREIYRILVEEVEENEAFLSAMERAGLSSPFDKVTFEKIVETMIK